MKKIVFISSIILMIGLSVKAQQNSPNYHHGTLTSAIAEATALGKPVFVKGYTTWCGWCVRLDKNVLSQEKVYSYLDDNYVSIKVNMETTEGRAIASKYGVTGFPTMLVLDSSGKLTKKIVGYKQADELLSLIQR